MVCESVFTYTELAFCAVVGPRSHSVSHFQSLTFSHTYSLTLVHFVSLLTCCSSFFRQATIFFSLLIPWLWCCLRFSVWCCRAKKKSVLWLLGYRETQRISEDLLSCMAFSIKELFKASYCIICLEKNTFYYVLHCSMSFEPDADNCSQSHVSFPVTLWLFCYKQLPL